LFKVFHLKGVKPEAKIVELASILKQGHKKRGNYLSAIPSFFN